MALRVANLVLSCFVVCHSYPGPRSAEGGDNYLTRKVLNAVAAWPGGPYEGSATRRASTYEEERSLSGHP